MVTLTLFVAAEAVVRTERRGCAKRALRKGYRGSSRRTSDGFDQITCHSSAPTTVAYNKPKYQGDRLDWCLSWGQGCGQAAADAFCQWKGHASAMSFTEANDIGDTTPTRLISTGAVCDQDFCDGFKKITCQS